MGNLQLYHGERKKPETSYICTFNDDDNVHFVLV